MAKLKKILMITCSFPPDGGPGTFRPLGMVRHLRKFGWQPFVLTLPADFNAVTDPFLAGKVPQDIKVARVPYWGWRMQKIIFNNGAGSSKTLGGAKKNNGAAFIKRGLKEIANLFFIPDNMNRWIFNAYRAGSKMIKDEKIDLIWSTSPACSAQLVGLLLKNKYRVPWVADFRDPWTSSFLDNKNYLWRKINGRLEKNVLASSDKIVTVANGLRTDLFKRHPWLDPDKVVVITNGFEKDDFPAAAPEKTRQLTITHTGSFYGKRTPLVFLEAVKELLDEAPEIRDNLKIKLVGNFNAELAEKINAVGLGDNLEIVSQVSHDECLKLQRQSDVLLLIPGKKTLSMPGKIFEYLAAGRPILALEEDASDSADLIREAKSGFIAPPEDAAAIKEVLKNIFSLYSRGELGIMPNSKINNYSREKLAEKMAILFDALIKK